MSEPLEIYKTWAPDTARWTQWAKPVMFMHLKNVKQLKKEQTNVVPSSWTSYQHNRMIIVDLAHGHSINVGLSLAKQGYRPVPLYNSVPTDDKAMVPTASIVAGLYYGAKLLPQFKLSNEANPVFLLDNKRVDGTFKKRRGTFDNRWCVVPQDMPSAEYVKRHGITEVVVRTNRMQQDLQYILARYQKAGLAIYLCDDKKKVTLSGPIKPKRMRLFYRFLLLLGFSRHAAGGFGMSIPEASSGGGSYRAG